MAQVFSKVIGNRSLDGYNRGGASPAPLRDHLLIADEDDAFL